MSARGRHRAKKAARRLARALLVVGVAFAVVAGAGWLIALYVVPWVPAVLAVLAVVIAACFYVWFWG